MGSWEKTDKSGAICLRIILFANLMAIIPYGAITPHELYKVKAECVTISITGLAIAVQVFMVFSKFNCLPYNIWATLALDGLCAIGWCVAIALLSYWDRVIVYSPQSGDPAAWFECAREPTWEKVLTDDGIGKWIDLVWCEVQVHGRDRLVGNGAARQQLHVLIGLSVVSLLFTGSILLWTISKGRQYGLIRQGSYRGAA